MTWFNAHRAAPIGVDYDGRYLRAAQLARAGQGWRLQAAVRVPRVAPGEELGAKDLAHLQGTLVRLGFAGKRLVLAAPEEKLAVDILELPPRGSSAPVDEIARTELARTHGYEPSAAEMVGWDLPRSSRTKDMTQMMAVALRHSDADTLLDTFDQANLDVEVLDTTMAALVRACRGLLAEKGLTAILDYGWDWALLLVLREGTVIYRRLMPENALRVAAQTIGKNFNLPPESVDCLLEEVGLAGAVQSTRAASVPLDAITTCVRRPLDACAEALEAAFSYAGQMYAGAGPEAILVTGLGAAIPSVDRRLEARLGVETQIVIPSDIAQPVPGAADAAKDPSLVATVGLAMVQQGKAHAEHQSHSVVSA
ncbi:MAG: pilus assembly protein PilM [Planctomycetes bacterium]|nr:pilus assembly protein PilM [Planctomycetota bacterium]